MNRLDDSEIEMISGEYTYVQVNITASALDRISELISAIPSTDDRAMAEVHIDLNDYHELGDSDALVDEVLSKTKNIGMIVFYA